jgi:hypothetical protein
LALLKGDEGDRVQNSMSLGLKFGIIGWHEIKRPFALSSGNYFITVTTNDRTPVPSSENDRYLPVQYPNFNQPDF